MQNFDKLPPEQRPVVALISRPTAFSVSIVETLLSNYCRVNVFSNNSSRWQNYLANVSNKKNISINNENIFKGNEEYLLVLLNEVSKKNISKEFSRFSPPSKKLNTKTLFVLPYRFQEYISSQVKNLEDNVGIVYTGDLFGPRIEINSEPTSGIIFSALHTNKITVSKGLILHPLFYSDASKQIVNWLFSFGPYGQETYLLGKPMSAVEFATMTKKFIPETQISVKDFHEEKPFFGNVKVNYLDTKVEFILGETLNWLQKNKPKTEKIKLPQIKKPKISLNFKNTFPIKTFFITALFLLILLISPYTLLLASVSVLDIAKSRVLEGENRSAQKYLSSARGLNNLARKEANFFTSIPLLGVAYEPALNFSNLLDRGLNVGERAIRLGEKATDLTSKIFGNEQYDIYYYSENIRLDLDFLFKETLFFEGELGSSEGITKTALSPISKNIPFKEIKNFLTNGKIIAEELPLILGEDERKSYLVLFQNNMELRPTGGFIGSYAIVTFEKGRMVDIDVQDVYAADGQLRGYVEPPEPIRDYLGEAAWFLRDSNWDPDFPTAASHAEWFLERSVDKKVDGVVGIDLELAKRIIKEIGPVYISDFGIQLDENNLYETTQHEVEAGFFPGSQRKKVFLTAFSRELITRLIDLEKEYYFGVVRAFTSSLDERHVQVYLHNTDAQQAFSNLGWDGSVGPISCSGNCYPDWFGMVEANVGVNKVNYFIERSADLSVSIDNNIVRRTLIVRYTNKANPALGGDSVYKAYLRVVGPQFSEYGQTEIVGGQSREVFSPEINQLQGRKEAGILIEISPGQTKSIVFSWHDKQEVTFEEPGEYKLLWRKQAGVGADNISVSFTIPSHKQLKSKLPLTLTNEGSFSYNTLLTRDFVSRIYWE